TAHQALLGVHPALSILYRGVQGSEQLVHSERLRQKTKTATGQRRHGVRLAAHEHDGYSTPPCQQRKRETVVVRHGPIDDGSEKMPFQQLLNGAVRALNALDGVAR